LSLPELDREFLRKTLADFEDVLASAENAKKKHLLRQLVKKVLVHSRDTVEVWYGLPGPDPARIAGIMAPRKQPLSELSQVPSRPSSAPSEPWPTMQDVWYDHRSQIVIARKMLSIPRPVRQANRPVRSVIAEPGRPGMKPGDKGTSSVPPGLP